MNYFKECIGKEYMPVKYGKHEGCHPVRVKETFEKLEGTKEADVIVALVYRIAVLEQRSQGFAESNERRERTCKQSIQ